MIYLFSIWLTWCAVNLLAMLSVPLWAKQPCTNGFTIHIPPASVAHLTPAQRHAVWLHERGHLAHWHPWLNLARAVCGMRRSAALAQRQEEEADDWAAERCDPLDLAGALLNLAGDIPRVERLVRQRVPSAI